MATRFRFRLETLLKLREALEKEAQRQLARTIQARQAIEERLETLEIRYAETREELRVQKGAAVDLQRWRAVERFRVVLEKRMETTREELRQAEEKVMAARRALTKAHQNRLMLVRLKERRREVHLQEQLHDETREMDELAVLRYRFNTARPKAVMAGEVSP